MKEVIHTTSIYGNIKCYSNKQITDDELNMILTAGSYVSSGIGQQTIIVVIQDPEIIAQLSGINARVLKKDIDPFYGAPTVIAVFADAERLTHEKEGSLIIGNMMLAAASIGVDSAWVDRAKEVFESEEGKLFKKKWGVPDGYIGVANCLLGYCDNELFDIIERKPGKIIRV